MKNPSILDVTSPARPTWARGMKLVTTLAVSFAGLAVAVGSSAPLAGCGESAGCQHLRENTFADRESWGGGCNVDTDCIEVFGNPSDCTGVLTCNFAVLRTNRETAEQAVLKIAAQSQGCYVCGVPTCPAGDLAVCETVTHQCLVVTAELEGGAPVSEPAEASAPEASAPIFVDASTGDATGD
ncbi:MAG: hypothetical protein FWD17_03025 [Polyangiaceae bacterium]|nr:hypothetical protein [Polyangiaceae bacterium]